MTSVVLVDNGGAVVEYVTAEEEDPQQDREEAEYFPAVIVEEVPGASMAEEQGYSAQVLVYDDEVYQMQEVGDEQEVETEVVAVEASVHGNHVYCSDKTIEAAEALLRMDSLPASEKP
ncbi:hypothetical protein KUCAC02_016006 [Chaenocephalus aceratus]|uniref:Uncharacterized protein n=1 Tax=Chaenocephalus aceratus TaxID=36190 RepID=A0ACB9Y033_CHAAC|nr:hypothetical protein KUCAC02_016006 [Chaenocephalus aceratus]